MNTATCFEEKEELLLGNEDDMIDPIYPSLVYPFLVYPFLVYPSLAYPSLVYLR